MLQRLRNIGPGIVIAATGLGAGDLIAPYTPLVFEIQLLQTKD